MTPIASLVDAMADEAPRHRAPDSVKVTLRGDPLSFRLANGPDAPVQKRLLPGQGTLADVVGLLVGHVIPMRTTLDGRVAGWYRIGPLAGPLPAETRVDQVDREEVLYFHFVESRSILVDLAIYVANDTKRGPTHRLRAPVNTAVPIASLLDGVASMLDLAPGDWVASLDDQALSPWAILEDRPLGPLPRLVIRRA
jgi:hypothetical protein